MDNNRSQTALDSTSGVTGPAQRPGIHKVHWAVVPSLLISTGEVVVVAMGTISAAAVIAKLDSPSIPSPNHRQPSKDECDRQNVHNLFPRKCLVGEFKHLVMRESGKCNRLSGSMIYV